MPEFTMMRVYYPRRLHVPPAGALMTMASPHFLCKRYNGCRSVCALPCNQAFRARRNDPPPGDPNKLVLAIFALAVAYVSVVILARLGWLSDVSHALSPRTWLNLDFPGFNVKWYWTNGP